MNLLNEYGCDEAQGYYFSRPVPGDHLLHWLETSAFGCRACHRGYTSRSGSRCRCKSFYERSEASPPSTTCCSADRRRECAGCDRQR